MEEDQDFVIVIQTVVVGITAVATCVTLFPLLITPLVTVHLNHVSIWNNLKTN